MTESSGLPPRALTGSLFLSGPDSPSAEMGFGVVGSCSGKMKLMISEGMLREAVKSPHCSLKGFLLREQPPNPPPTAHIGLSAPGSWSKLGTTSSMGKVFLSLGLSPAGCGDIEARGDPTCLLPWIVCAKVGPEDISSSPG